MANIKLELAHPIIDGQPLSFKAPCDCVAVTGIKVEYPDGDSNVSTVFTFADAHGNDLSGIGNLFVAGAMVRVVLDTNTNKAFIQNADTNAYLEGRFNELEEMVTAITSIPDDEDLDRLITPGRYACETDEQVKTLQACPVDKAFTLDVRYANGIGPHVGQELKPRDKGARLYRQFVHYSEILSAEAKKMYDRVRLLEPQKNAYDESGASTAWYTQGPKSDGYYHIGTISDLLGLANLVNNGTELFQGKTIVLDNDLVFNSGYASQWRNSGPSWSWTPIGKSNSYHFRGTFDGQGHYISGLYNPDKNDNGLFGFTTNAVIQNVAVINSYFGTTSTKGQFLSGAVARALGGVLRNIYSNAILVSGVSDWYTGGIAGCVQAGTVDSCVFEGDIYTNPENKGRYIGGITGGPDGASYTATITNCLFAGTIDTRSTEVGGIVGMLGGDDLIEGCVSVGVINHASRDYTGAIIGALENSGTAGHKIINCRYSRNLGLSLYGGKTVDSLNVDTTGSKELSAECEKHSMVPTKWAKVYDSENKMPLGDIGAMATEVLWVNANPGGYFGAQTLQLDLSAYDFVAVLAAESSAYSPTYMPAVVVPCSVGSHGTITGTGFDFTDAATPEVWMFNRSFSVLADGLKFGAGNQYAAHSRLNIYQNWNNKAVPMVILGIKGVVK